MSNCMTMSLRSTETVLFSPIEMLDSWTHQQYPEMIADQGQGTVCLSPYHPRLALELLPQHRLDT